MRRPPAGILLSLLAAGLFVLPAIGPVEAASRPGGGTAILMVVDRVSFEELLAQPAFSRLARAGGAGLMTTRTHQLDRSEQIGEEPQLAYETIGWGTVDVPTGESPSLLNQVLAAHRIPVCRFGGGPDPGRGTPSGILALRPNLGILPCGPLSRPSQTGRLVVVDTGGTFEADRSHAVDVGPALSREGRTLEEVRGAVADVRTLTLVVTPSPSTSMHEVGDEVTPLVMSIQGPGPPLPVGGTVSSDTTRTEGLVANVDIAPTILDFFGRPIPAEMDGQPVRLVEAAAPFQLHQRHLEQRRIRIPIQMAELAFVALVGLVGIPALLWIRRRGSLPGRLALLLQASALAVAALPIPLAAGGLLPRLTPAVVFPFVGVSVALLVAASLLTRQWHPLGPFVLLGAVGLAFVAADLAFGRGLRIPLLGATMFEGARFYGLPNAFLGLVLAGALFVAVALARFRGFVLLVVTGLAMGSPSIGADIGAAITLFVAAAVWWVLVVRAGRGTRLLDAAVAAGTVVAGMAAVLLANRFLAGTPTHATRFLETTGLGADDVFHLAADRLAIGFQLLKDQPAGWIPVLGIPVLFVLAVTRPEPLGQGLALVDRRWREVLITMTIAGAVSYFANDTGVAAVGLTFLYALVGLAYAAFLLADRPTWRRVAAPPEPERHG